MSNVITAIPIYSDASFEKFERAAKLLREVASEAIDLEKWTFFKEQPVGIGGVQFLDMRKIKPCG